MHALIAGRGPEWILDDVDEPAPGPGEVLVRNYAAATNNADLPMLAEADPANGGHGEGFIAGFEYAGEIVAVGDDAGDGKVGDAVMGPVPASFAEYVVADHRFVVPRPAGLSSDVAAALPTGLLTEHGALTVAGSERGQSVLVTGATSGIGTIGVQMAKALGASTVIATTRTAPHVNQILVHAGNTPSDLVDYCASRGVVVEAYSPIAHGVIPENPDIRTIADRYGVSVPQLCIRHTLQLGTVSLPNTANPEHMRSNAEVDFEISDEDMEALRNLDEKDYGESSAFPVYSGK